MTVNGLYLYGSCNGTSMAFFVHGWPSCDRIRWSWKVRTRSLVRHFHGFGKLASVVLSDITASKTFLGSLMRYCCAIVRPSILAQIAALPRPSIYTSRARSDASETCYSHRYTQSYARLLHLPLWLCSLFLHGPYATKLRSESSMRTVHK